MSPQDRSRVSAPDVENSLVAALGFEPPPSAATGNELLIEDGSGDGLDWSATDPPEAVHDGVEVSDGVVIDSTGEAPDVTMSPSKQRGKGPRTFSSGRHERASSNDTVESSALDDPATDERDHGPGDSSTASAVESDALLEEPVETIRIGFDELDEFDEQADPDKPATLDELDESLGGPGAAVSAASANRLSLDDDPAAFDAGSGYRRETSWFGRANAATGPVEIPSPELDGADPHGSDSDGFVVPAADHHGADPDGFVVPAAETTPASIDEVDPALDAVDEAFVVRPADDALIEPDATVGPAEFDHPDMRSDVGPIDDPPIGGTLAPAGAPPVAPNPGRHDLGFVRTPPTGDVGHTVDVVPTSPPVAPVADESLAAAPVTEAVPVADQPPARVGDPTIVPGAREQRNGLAVGAGIAARQAGAGMRTQLERAGAIRLPDLLDQGFLKRTRRVRARKVRRVVRHIDPWSVLTFSVLFFLCLFAAFLLASVLVWNAAVAAGTIENMESFITEIGDYETYEIKGDVVFRAAMVIAGILTLAASVMVVLLVVVFNLISDLVGGIRMTVVEEETVRVRRRRLTPAESPPGT